MDPSSSVFRVLEAYQEFQNPASLRAVERTKSTSPSATLSPVTFPESYPFSLLYDLPKPSSGAASQSSNQLYNAGMGESAMVFLVLALSSPRKVFLSFLESSLDIEGRDHFAALLIQIFRVGGSVLSNDAFPSNWLNSNILVHKVLIKIMDPIATLLEREFVPNEQTQTQPTQPVDNNVWREAFCLLLRLLSSEHLTIEEFSAQVSSFFKENIIPLH